MRRRRSLVEWLNDILLWGEKLARPIEGMDRQGFLTDEKSQDAAAKCAEAIGAAAREVLALQPDFDRTYPAARLSAAYASRNRLSHGYFSIDNNLLWTTVSQSIPATVAAVQTALAHIKSGAG